MKARNKRFYSTDREYLVTLRQEYIMLGFDTSLEDGVLTIYTYRRKQRKSEGNKSRRRY